MVQCFNQSIKFISGKSAHKLIVILINKRIGRAAVSDGGEGRGTAPPTTSVIKMFEKSKCYTYSQCFATIYFGT